MDCGTNGGSHDVMILGMGNALPKRSIGQQDAAKLAEAFSCHNEKQGRLLPVLYERTRVDRRASVLLEPNGTEERAAQSFFHALRHRDDRGPDTESRMSRYAAEAPGLALLSSKKALAEAHVLPNNIGHLVTVTCTGFAAPGFDIALIKGLGLSSGVTRTHIGFMGCHGIFNGLRVASALARENPKKGVLLCSVELCSLHFAYGWQPDRVVTNALFADGSSAAVISAVDGTSNGRTQGWILSACGSELFPDSEEAMTWEIGNHGFKMSLSARVPGLIGTHLRPWLTSWLEKQGLPMAEVRSWAIHPGGPRVLDTVVSALKLPDAAAGTSRRVLAENGNMSSATILFILDRLVRDQAPTPCVALGFGPGLVVEAALFRKGT